MQRMRAHFLAIAAVLSAALLAGCGQVSTNGAPTDVSDPVAPTITSQPASQSAVSGDNVNFTVAATGTAPLSYQWSRNGTLIDGAVAATYSTVATDADDGATYTVVVTNSVGSAQSTAATLTVAPALAITTQPAGQSVTAGQTATFNVIATGSAPLAYQWLKNGTAIAGATGASYTTPATTTADNGALFSVVVSSGDDSVTSHTATLSVTSSSGGAVAPTISTQPADQSITAGKTATFTVTASGTAPLSYQWQKNGAAIAGATATSYTTPAETTADSGATFSVVVSNSAGNVTSRSAVLTVTAVAPTITTQPANATVTAGQSATFTVVAAGTAPLTYQWTKNGTNIGGATGASYSTPAETTADNGASFAVTVTNSAGSITSHSAVLTVNAAPTGPTITTQPASQSVQVGQTATFSVVATGTAPLSYQWRKNGTAITGATSAAYTTPAETTADNGAVFAVVVSNSVGSVTSNNATLTVAAATVGTDVVTYKYDLGRTGQNTTETVLTKTNVNSSTFGLLHYLATDGKVDGQPLYLSQLSIAGVSHNVLFATTEAGSVYAFDANSGTQLWKTSLVPSGETVSGSLSCDEITPTIGITSTPVINRAAGAHGTMYVVAMTIGSDGVTYHQRLHALDVTTGAELLGGPTNIAATYSASSGTITFDPQQYVSKAGLLLLNGTVYIAWSSHCDFQFYTGWIMGYSASTLQQTTVLNVAPNSGGLGPSIWMAGGGVAADSAGNIYLMTANGVFEQTLNSGGFPNMGDYGDSILKLSTSAGLSVSDYFTPSNAAFLSSNDLDLGSGGILLLPDMTDSGGTTRHLAVGGGKDGNLYVVDRDNMGKFSASANNVYQQLTSALGTLGTNPTGGYGGMWGTPAYFNNTVFFCPVGVLSGYAISAARLSSTRTLSSVSFPYPGCSPSVSANGTGNGIIWAYVNTNPAVLYAFDASNLTTMLYNSNQAGTRDHWGDPTNNKNKWMVPTVADGMVFVGSAAGVAVFGLLN